MRYYAWLCCLCSIFLIFGVPSALVCSNNVQPLLCQKQAMVSLFDSKPKNSGMLRWPTVARYENKGCYFIEILKDVLLLHRYLFTADSFKVVTSIFPALVAARMFDCELQKNFYCRKHHKNRHQFNSTCHKTARFGIGVPMAILGSMAFFAPDDELRITSYAFILGIPFVVFGKDMLKGLKTEGCKRPWNEFFDCNERAYGGCPSGHMAQATYMTVLYGKRFGIKFAAPLTIFATYLGANFLNCNRHYLSQLVAGVGLGTIYALAVDKLIDRKLSNPFSLGIGCNKYGPTATVSCSF